MFPGFPVLFQTQLTWISDFVWFHLSFHIFLLGLVDFLLWSMVALLGATRFSFLLKYRLTSGCSKTKGKSSAKPTSTPLKVTVMKWCKWTTFPFLKIKHKKKKPTNPWTMTNNVPINLSKFCLFLSGVFLMTRLTDIFVASSSVNDFFKVDLNWGNKRTCLC